MTIHKGMETDKDLNRAGKNEVKLSNFLMSFFFTMSD